MKALFFLLLICFTTYSTVGQVLRINHKELGQDTLVGWHGDFEVDFLLNNLSSTQEEQSNYLGFKILSNASYFTKQHQYYLKNELRYFKANGSEFLNRGYGYLRANWNRKRTLHSESVLQVQFDNIRHLNLRWLAMQGLKVVFVDNGSHEMDFGAGLMFEHEEWTDFSREDLIITKNLAKISSYLGWYTDFNNRIFLSFLTYYQVGYDPQDDIFRHRIDGSLELSDKISKKVEWILRFQLHYDSAPIVPVAPLIYELMNGIKIRF